MLFLPIHPRTIKNLDSTPLGTRARGLENLVLTEPLPYLDFSRLMSGAKVVLTDSGGIQEETTYLGIPCLTLRENTERPSTVEMGTNHIVGVDPQRILAAFIEAMARPRADAKVPPLWDGHAAERIVRICLDEI